MSLIQGASHRPNAVCYMIDKGSIFHITNAQDMFDIIIAHGNAVSPKRTESIVHILMTIITTITRNKNMEQDI